MTTRRRWMGMAAGAVAGAAIGPLPMASAMAAAPLPLLTRAVPSSGERVPVVGLGSSATFSQAARGEDVTALREVLAKLVELGGTVVDTAPQYGAAEAVAGRIADELGVSDRIFWATKVNVARGGSADPAAAREQIETSFRRLRKRPLDLVQVHNLGDVRTQLPILRELKQARRIRYIGVTTTFERQYPQLEEILRSEPIDFIGIDYAVDNRHVERTILPLAADRGIGVLVYAPFGRTRLWSRVAGREVPAWASEFDATSWAQFFIKFVLAHPAVTAVTPATSRVRHVIDNLGGGVGRLPDAAMRQRMVELVASLPGA
jgi:aryl-alcohol dehydrogenase-like predicted oxidoreductase